MFFPLRERDVISGIWRIITRNSRILENAKTERPWKQD